MFDRSEKELEEQGLTPAQAGEARRRAVRLAGDPNSTVEMNSGVGADLSGKQGQQSQTANQSRDLGNRGRSGKDDGNEKLWDHRRRRDRDRRAKKQTKGKRNQKDKHEDQKAKKNQETGEKEKKGRSKTTEKHKLSHTQTKKGLWQKAKDFARGIKEGLIGKPDSSKVAAQTTDRVRNFYEGLKNGLRPKAKVDPSKVIPFPKKQGLLARMKGMAKSVYNKVVNPVTKSISKKAAKLAWEGTKLFGKAGWFGGKTAVKGLKLLGFVARKIPLLSVGVGTAFAAWELSKGNRERAAAHFTAGLVANIPYIGTAAAIAIEAPMLAKDLGVEKQAKEMLAQGAGLVFGEQKGRQYVNTALNETQKALDYVNKNTLQTETGNKVMSYLEGKSKVAVASVSTAASSMWNSVQTHAQDQNAPAQTPDRVVQKGGRTLSVFNGGKGPTQIPSPDGALAQEGPATNSGVSKAREGSR